MSEVLATPLIAHCLCKQNHILVPTTLPRTAHVCHCTTCRTSHGSLFAMHTDLDTLPFSPDAPPNTLKVYSSGPGAGKAFFCKTCGTYMFASYFYMLEGEKKEGNCVSTGCVSLSPEYQYSNPSAKLEDVLSVDFHCVIKDTVDGGAAPWVGNWDAEGQVHFNGLWEEPPIGTEEEMKEIARKHTYPAGRTELDGCCKCGSSKVKVTRDDVSIRYRTTFCACDSCRLSTGTDVIPFTRVPRANAFFIKDGQPLEWPKVWDDTAKAQFSQFIVYESTPDKVYWGSCGTCGAGVFYQRQGDQIDGIDVVQPFTGLFGADEKRGILHLDFLEWLEDNGEPIGLIGDAYNAGRAGIITKNMSAKFGEWLKGRETH